MRRLEDEARKEREKTMKPTPTRDHIDHLYELLEDLSCIGVHKDCGDECADKENYNYITEQIEDYITQQKIELLERVKKNLPDEDTDCSRDYMHDHPQDDGCDPKDHWRRDGRFFMRMEIGDFVEECIDGLKEKKNTTPKNPPKDRAVKPNRGK